MQPPHEEPRHFLVYERWRPLIGKDRIVTSRAPLRLTPSESADAAVLRIVKQRAHEAQRALETGSYRVRALRIEETDPASGATRVVWEPTNGDPFLFT